MSKIAVAVLGAGTMGNGIAQVFAQHGHPVILRDLTTDILDHARGQIAKSLGRLTEKGKLAPTDRDATLARITATTDFDAVAGADLVVEAVVENLEAKRKVFQDLDRVAKAGAILASNTSSISITKLGAATKRPRARSSRGWWTQAGWAARPGAGSTPTPRARP
jgi:3-hydroxybutyryl-CoA dehydrogenase